MGERGDMGGRVKRVMMGGRKVRGVRREREPF